MSWQSYIDHIMGDNGKFKEAAICGPDGSVWAKSPDFKMSVEEVMKLNDGEAKLSQDGVYMGGVKYIVLRYRLNDDDDPYMIVKASISVDGGNNTACIYRSKTAFLIGIGAPETPGEEVNEVVRNIFAHMKQAGF